MFDLLSSDNNYFIFMPIFNALKPLIKIMNSLFTSIIRLPFARKTWAKGGILLSLVLSTGILSGCKTPAHTAALNAVKGQEELSGEFNQISFLNGNYLIKKDKFFGLYSKSGDIIIPCEFNQISFFNGGYLVKKDKFFGLYSKSGDIIIPCEFNQISFFKGDYRVNKGKFFGLCSKSGDCIIPCKFDQINFLNGNYRVKKGNKQGLYNADGQEILP